MGPPNNECPLELYVLFTNESDEVSLDRGLDPIICYNDFLNPLVFGSFVGKLTSYNKNNVDDEATRAYTPSVHMANSRLLCNKRRDHFRVPARNKGNSGYVLCWSKPIRWANN